MLESYYKLQPKLKTVPKFICTLADLVCLAGEIHCQRCERQPQLTTGMCVSQLWKFCIRNVTVRITDTNCYIKLNVI